jgi:superfamily I DNA/RNA helicase
MKKRSNVRFDEQAVALIDDQVEMLCAIAEGLNGVREIEDRINALFTDTDGREKPAVTLSTVHKAKGLEWNRVFVLNETFKWRGGQEDNVYYVAVTRAKKHLTFVGERPEPKN